MLHSSVLSASAPARARPGRRRPSVQVAAASGPRVASQGAAERLTQEERSSFTRRALVASLGLLSFGASNRAAIAAPDSGDWTSPGLAKGGPTPTCVSALFTLSLAAMPYFALAAESSSSAHHVSEDNHGAGLPDTSTLGFHSVASPREPHALPTHPVSPAADQVQEAPERRDLRGDLRGQARAPPRAAPAAAPGGVAPVLRPSRPRLTAGNCVGPFRAAASPPPPGTSPSSTTS